MAYTTSQTVKDLFASETPQVFRGTFTFADSTTLVVDQSKVIMGSLVLDRSCVSGNSLELGSCVASEFSMTLLNADGSLDGKNFEGAELYAEIGVSDGTNTYYIPLGRFIVDGVPKVRDTVSINALDRMVKFDKTADATLTATWWGPGVTIQQIINRCCSMCGVTLLTNIASFPNANVTLGTVDEVFTSGVTDITYRQLLSYCVGAMGKCAWMNAEGNLEIGFAEPLNISTSAIAGIAIAGLAIVGNSSGSGVIKQILEEGNRYSSDYEDYVIVTTGAFCDKTETDESDEQFTHHYIIGSDDYAFDLTDNPIVAWKPQTLLANLTGVIGITYHPMSAVTVPYPWLFPLDWVAYKKGDTNLYSIVTGFTFTMNGNNGIKSVGESPQEKSLASVGSVTSLVRSANGALEVKIAKSIAELEETLEEQIDSKVETWCQSTNPATAWTSTELKAQHNGDLWFYTGTSSLTVDGVTIQPSRTYQYNNSTGKWVAYNNPSTSLFDFADGKSTVYYGTPTGSYSGVETGDYLVDSTDGSTYRWTGSAWNKVTDYTTAISSAVSTLRTDLESQIDAQIETWVQNTAPSTNWTTSALQTQHNGDLWYYTGLSNITVNGVTIEPSKAYQYSSSTNRWVAYNNPITSLFDLADGKTTIYYGTPSGTYSNVETGDYLVDSTTGSTYRWNGSAWAKMTDYATAISNAKTGLETAISTATSLITGNSGGYVVIHDSNNDGKPDEILIMDTDDISTATKVWRWNQLGLGYSSTGYSGTYGLAMTANGEIVADYINTGVIRDGTGANANSWDLVNGILNLNITGGSIHLNTFADSVDYISLTHADTEVTVASNYFRAITTDSKWQQYAGADKLDVYVGEWLTPASMPQFGVKVTKYQYDSTAGDYVERERTTITNDGIEVEALDSSGVQQTYSALSFTGLVVNNSLMNDFVIGEGTSGSWFYRKWNSGRYECWMRDSSKKATIDTAWGGLYYGTISAYPYPITFVGDYPVVNITVQAANGGCWAVPNYSDYSFTSTGTIYLYRPTTVSNMNITVNIYACGRWE